MFAEILRNIFVFPNSDAFEVFTFAFNGIVNQFDRFIQNLPYLAIAFGALSTVIGFGVSIVRKTAKGTLRSKKKK